MCHADFSFSYVYSVITLISHHMKHTSNALLFLLRRLAAFLYDCLLLIAIFFIIATIAIALNDGQAVQHPLFYVALLIVAYLFFDWFWRHGGQTLGMRAWRIKVVATNQEKVTFKQSASRFITGLALFGFTYISVFVSPSQQALHDKLSKTKIIRYNK